MVALLAYTVEVGVVFAVLIAIYRHVYYGISYNRWERGYLLATTVMSYVLPLLKVGYVMAPVPAPADRIVAIDGRFDQYDVITISRPEYADSFLSLLARSTFFETLIVILFAVYVAGMAVKSVSFVRGLHKTLRLARQSKKVADMGGVAVYDTNVNTVAFSFFNNIFLGIKLHGLSDEEKDVVIRHEMQHVMGWHSVDTLVFGVFSVLQWFNPMARLAARYSRIVCENIADSQAVSDGKLTEYSQLVLRLGIQNSDKPVLRAPKRKSPLVDRIAQLLNTDSVNIRRVRFYAALPVLAVAVAAYIVYFGMLTPIDPRYDVPVQGGYEVMAGYFNEQKICTVDGNIYVVSHKLVNLRFDDGAVVVPPAEAMDYQTIGNVHKFRLGSYTVTIEGTAAGDNDIPASLAVTDQKGNAIDPQLIFKL